MSNRVKKAANDVERTKERIAELQALLPELERKKTEAENTETIRILRSANISFDEIAAYVESIKKTGRIDTISINNQSEVSKNDTE